eukprot:2511961-Pyramimonas_sp.AAC.1
MRGCTTTLTLYYKQRARISTALAYATVSIPAHPPPSVALYHLDLSEVHVLVLLLLLGGLARHLRDPPASVHDGFIRVRLHRLPLRLVTAT